MKKFLCYFLSGAIIIGGAVYAIFFTREETVNFRYGKILTEQVIAAIVATGTVEPEELVDVGTQVGGMIIEFGKDQNGKPIDYGSRVTLDMILAKIDDALYLVDMRQAEAQMLQAQAQKANNEATVKQQLANLHLTKRNWERAHTLKNDAIVSQAALENADFEYEKAQANLAAATAQVLQADASIATAQTSYDRAKRNLNYCIITSPVEGIIIDRRVNIGQTVVSSMNAPSLFLIAKDLRKMQIWVSVNEADIGNIRQGQEVEFTVDAFPNEQFSGVVEKVRLNASMSQNIVSYIVEVTTDNQAERLLPYLTANVNFILQRSENGSLSVPNAAMRFKPEEKLVSAPYHEILSRAGEMRKKAIIWVERDKKLMPIEVKIGVNDGTRSEIFADDLRVDDLLVVGMENKNNSGNPTSANQSGGARNNNASPFMPQMPTRQRR